MGSAMAISVPEFQAIHDRFRPRLLRYAARLVGPTDAEDLVQAVLIKVHEGLSGYRGEAALSTWIYRIATHAALDHLRQRAARPATQALPEEDEARADPARPAAASAESDAVRAEMGACVREFVARLPPDHAAVIALAEVEGFTNPEIAAILGVSLHTAKIRLHRARERLRRELAAGCALGPAADGEVACERRHPIVLSRPRSP